MQMTSSTCSRARITTVPMVSSSLKTGIPAMMRDPSEVGLAT